MKKIRLGKTELMATIPSMGCLPLQRCDRDYGVRLVRAAYEAGINFFDTANAYTDSESKMGEALHDVRGEVILATKSAAKTRDGVLAHIENSLRNFRTDYIDLFQLHNVAALPNAADPNGAYAGALEAQRQGMVRHIGVTTHRIGVAEECVDSGLFETMQFPFCYISSERDLALAELCREKDMGFIAMKGLAGGLLTNARACQAFMSRHDNVVPIWGIQRFGELQEWLDAAAEEERNGGAWDDPEIWDFISRERRELSGTFCRSCGYCMPCPQGIEIRNCARMNMLLRRSPWQQYFTPEWQAKMAKIEDCLECGACSSKCPYELDTPSLLKAMLKDYREFYEEHRHLLPA